jgi:hypothetical protein
MFNLEEKDEPVVLELKRYALIIAKRFLRNVTIKVNVDLKSKNVILNIEIHNY